MTEGVHPPPLEDLEFAVRQNWGYASSASGDWNPDNPALGQAPATALVIQDHLGGKVVHALAVLPDGSRVQHVRNVIDDVDHDFTAQQFPEGTHIRTYRSLPVDREALLGDDELARRRYEHFSTGVVNTLYELAHSRDARKPVD